MKEIASSLPAHVRETVLTVGTFDGVHRGHLDVLHRVAERASETGRAGVLVTFDPHPLEVLRPDSAPPLLTSRSEKLAAIASTGIEYIATVRFTQALSRYPAEQFVDLVLRERFRMAELLIGHDHGFGRGRAGDVETLRMLGAKEGFRVEVIPPVTMPDGRPVSSTVIREAVASGDLSTAAEALGRPYALVGTVVAGDGRGRSLGFRTINVELESSRKLLPLDGVYAVRVSSEQGQFGGMMNLGGRPTFGDERRSLEAHLFDVDLDFYGSMVEVSVIERLRDVKKFSGPDALMAQLAEDEQRARVALTLLPEWANLRGSMHFPPSTP